MDFADPTKYSDSGVRLVGGRICFKGKLHVPVSQLIGSLNVSDPGKGL